MSKRFLFSVFLMMVLAGCATTQNQTLVTQLQLRVGELEQQIDLKEDKIQDLEEGLQDLSHEIVTLKNQIRRQQPEGTVVRRPAQPEKVKEGIIRVTASTQQVQQALKNAGYYNGNVDGKIGQQTENAITKFQKDQGLKADGIVGEKTWLALKTYLE